MVVEHKRRIPVRGPLDQYQNNQVTEDRVDEDHLGNEDEVECQHVLPRVCMYACMYVCV
jgi:hypothetical protein